MENFQPTHLFELASKVYAEITESNAEQIIGPIPIIGPIFKPLAILVANIFGSLVGGISSTYVYTPPLKGIHSQFYDNFYIGTVMALLGPSAFIFSLLRVLPLPLFILLLPVYVFLLLPLLILIGIVLVPVANLIAGIFALVSTLIPILFKII